MALLPVLLTSLILPAHARRRDTPTVPTVPAIEDVVAAEGFVPTPSQSDIYRPGTVLVPNGRGGHDVVVDRCIDAEPNVAVMSQSSIATTLSGGVSARLAAARGEVSGGVEKRLSFVDPEQRTISLGKLQANESCLTEVDNAARFQDLSEAIVIHDVLVAVIQNTICTRATASGQVVALGAAEAAAFSECVQESDGQVPLGYKAVMLSQLVAPASKPDVPGVGEAAHDAGPPAAPRSDVSFETAGGLDVQAKLAQQRCIAEADAAVRAHREQRMTEFEAELQAKAAAAWETIRADAMACRELPLADRGPCMDAVGSWLETARAMRLTLPAGVEEVETACGPIGVTVAAEERTVQAKDYNFAAVLAIALEAPLDGRTPEERLAALAARNPQPTVPKAVLDELLPEVGVPELDRLTNKVRATVADSPTAVALGARGALGRSWQRTAWRDGVCEAARAETAAHHAATREALQPLVSKVTLAKLNLPQTLQDAGLKAVQVPAVLRDFFIVEAFIKHAAGTKFSLADACD